MKQCDGCTLCCRVMKIVELEKPINQWCNHCGTRKSCDIYEDRPTECRDFVCGYLDLPHLDSRWKPSKSKFLIVGEDAKRVVLHVHPDFPNSWRKEPYYSTLKEWAAAGSEELGQVIVMIEKRAIAVLPDHDTDLGEVSDDDRFVSIVKKSSAGPRLTIEKYHKDDPSLAGMEVGVPQYKI